jgi:SAM-dependent methyltransferase
MIDWNDEAGHFDEHWARLAAPARTAVADRLEIGPGKRVLDVGCGSGDFLALAQSRGASASGFDASPEMIELARTRAPGADLRVGSMEALPYAGAAFDAVTGFNSLQFADDRVAALREWARVVAPGGAISVCAWAEPERCEVDVVEDALRELASYGPARAPFGPEIEEVARRAGLEVVHAEDVPVPYEVADQEELEVAFLLDARGYGAIEAAGESASRAAITAAAAPFRRRDGSYRFDNVFRCVISRPSASRTPAAT